MNDAILKKQKANKTFKVRKRKQKNPKNTNSEKGS